MTNRNRKLSLNEAWQHYWSELFPGGVDWRADLAREIRDRLYSPGDASGFMDASRSAHESPPWGDDLDIDLQGNFVRVKFKENDIGKFPIHAYGNLLMLSNWENNNPLENASSLPELTARHQEACRDLANSAVRDCGNRIHNKFLGMLKDIKEPKFEIYCRPSDDVFAKERALPAYGLSKIVRLDLVENDLWDSLGIPKYSQVQIKLRRHSASKVGAHGSLEKPDATLLEKMKSLIDDGTVPNVRQAALAVISEAFRRRTGLDEWATDESVLRRLQNKFSKKYPNYSNLRAKIRPKSSK